MIPQGFPPTQERKESTAHLIEACFEAELGEMRDSPRRAWFPRVTAARPALVIFRGAYIASSTGPQLRLIDQKVRRTYQVQPGDSRAAELLNW